MSLEETLRRIERRLERIDAELRELKSQMLEGMKVTELQLALLPNHLRRTAAGLRRVGQGTAEDVSRCTNRARAVESAYLNQLERQGLVRSHRAGRRKIFSLQDNRRDNALK